VVVGVKLGKDLVPILLKETLEQFQPIAQTWVPLLPHSGQGENDAGSKVLSFRKYLDTNIADFAPVWLFRGGKLGFFLAVGEPLKFEETAIPSQVFTARGIR